MSIGAIILIILIIALLGGFSGIGGGPFYGTGYHGGGGLGPRRARAPYIGSPGKIDRELEPRKSAEVLRRRSTNSHRAIGGPTRSNSLTPSSIRSRTSGWADPPYAGQHSENLQPGKRRATFP